MKKYKQKSIQKIVFRLISICLLFFLGISVLLANPHEFKKMPGSPLEGRWDLRLYDSGIVSPSWLEVHHSGKSTLIGQFVGSGGSARPISRIHFANGRLSFSIPPQWESDSSDLVFEANFLGDSLSGFVTTPDGKKYRMTGIRAPSLKRTMEPVWGKQIKLFNGINLDGWHASGKNQWKVDSGIMICPVKGSNIISDRTFTDFKLHVEFRYSKGANSGIYLRGRYEIQIIDSKGSEPSRDLLGALYGFITPTDMMAKAAGEWQSLDVTLVGRQISLSVNGKSVICNAEIPGITGGALDSNEGLPGPIMFQGDHDPVDFRNILIIPSI